MSGLLLALGFGSGPAVVEPPEPQRFRIEAVVFKGDPLGSKAGGTLKCLAEPVLVTLDGQTTSFLSGGRLPVQAGYGTINEIPVGVTVKLTPKGQPDGSIRLRVEAEVTEVTTGSGLARRPVGFTRAVMPDEIEVTKRAAGTTRSVQPGEMVRVRIMADSPTDQTWAELTVSLVPAEK
ncbi:MAG TPA: hypothetical protein VKE74_26365 [Gemmataceae bacterium]|nr:hypothetical protein [Gemmataceae bacterium]